ncbi:MAG: hypothetical protein JNG88_07370 [Phycisphaerales bacterium]|nr:hypothetical protein [Phycisphaerales bacterium]
MSFLRMAIAGSWVIAMAASLQGQTSRISISTSGAEGDANSGWFLGHETNWWYWQNPGGVAISADGNRIVFESKAENFATGDADSNSTDVFLRERSAGTTIQVSPLSTSTSYFFDPVISPNGSYVAYQAIVPGEIPYTARYTVSSQTRCVVNRDVPGYDGLNGCYQAAVASDGAVVFEHHYSGGSAHFPTGYWWNGSDYICPITEAGASCDTDQGSNSGTACGNSVTIAYSRPAEFSPGPSPSVSGDGSVVSFVGLTYYIFCDANAVAQIFARATSSCTNGTYELISKSSGGAAANQDCIDPYISNTGQFVVFASAASNLVSGSSNGYLQIYVVDRTANTIRRVSVSTGGALANGDCRKPSITANGRYVAFESEATNLVSGDTEGHTDIFVRDRDLDGNGTLDNPTLGNTVATYRVSVSSSGAGGNQSSFGPSIAATASPVVVAFSSDASNLVSGDTNGFMDVFVHVGLP